MFKGHYYSFPQLIFPLCVKRVGTFEHPQPGDKDLSNCIILFKMFNAQCVELGECGTLKF